MAQPDPPICYDRPILDEGDAAAPPMDMTVPTKRPCSEQQLRHLAAARKKAMDNREARKASAEQPQQQPEDEGEDEEETAAYAAPKPQPRTMSYQERYYQAKFEKLQSQADHDRHMARYRQAPAETHAAAVAKQQLRERLDKEAYQRAYAQLFGD